MLGECWVKSTLALPVDSAAARAPRRAGGGIADVVDHTGTSTPSGVGVVLCSTLRRVPDVDSSYRADYFRERHGIEVEWANEALDDPDALRISPDPASRSGRSVRTIGYSPQAGCLITVITVDEEGVAYGVNSWRSNDTDASRYREERA
jgi:hypothetical protein